MAGDIEKLKGPSGFSCGVPANSLKMYVVGAGGVGGSGCEPAERGWLHPTAQCARLWTGSNCRVSAGQRRRRARTDAGGPLRAPPSGYRLPGVDTSPPAV
eukprot:4874556-Pyramimonas_sp.AAC.2